MGYDEAILKRQNSPRQLDRKYGVDPRAAPRTKDEDDGFEHRRGARYSNGLLDRQSMSGNPRSYVRPQNEEDLEGLHSSQPALRTYRDPDVNRGGRNQTRSSPVYKTRREQIYYDDDDADFSASQPAPQRSHYRPVNGRPLEDWERPRQQPPVYSGAIRRVTEHREMVDRRRADYDIDADYDLDDRPIRREYGDPHDRVQPYLAGDDAFDRDAVPRTSSKTRINVPARQLPLVMIANAASCKVVQGIFLTPGSR
ncbi:hypothetical protein BC829DRAFT_421192 [Chytridium lagenaria]|nr:hypothetical protein BC829DRAFT_421192 [Chytridium lagenaria]